MTGNRARAAWGDGAGVPTRVGDGGADERYLVVEGALAFRSTEAPSGSARSFHRTHPLYATTSLRPVTLLRDRSHAAKVWLKDESERLGLPSFKILGASWAIYRALARLAGDLPPDTPSFDAMVDMAKGLGPVVLVAPTDGNHGHAVAHVARMVGLEASIFVPAATSPFRIQAIEAKGAACRVIDGGYEDTVARAARESDERHIVVSDTSWSGYDTVPRWVIEGYATIFEEIDEQLTATSGTAQVDIVVVQAGVGALCAAAVAHYRAPGRRGTPHILVVEPVGSACILRSVQAGSLLTIDGPQGSIMAGLNCGRPSEVAWPLVSEGVDSFVEIEDHWAEEAMRVLAADGVAAGETGAAGAAALLAVAEDPHLAPVADWIGLQHDPTVVVLCTEGATDPHSYRLIVGDPEPPMNHGHEGAP